ncbi:MAG TPA: glycoside hydrolase family 130 protein [Acidimicrobiia bacterium]|nr:glycoside hydrolase family 130 protein [Acidimicrobiia bacterium]
MSSAGSDGPAPAAHRHDHIRLVGDPRRVIAKPFLPGEQIFPDGRSRLEVVSTRIMNLTEVEVRETLDAVLEGFVGRHRDFVAVLERHHLLVAERLGLPEGLTPERRLLIGAYFTHEYSVEAAALGNPSMVAAPDQSGLGEGETRFVMSLRAVGEGHISSVEFRSGVIGPDAAIVLDPPSRYAATGHRTTPTYDRGFFRTKMADLGALNDVATVVLDSLGDHFTMADLTEAILALDGQGVGRAAASETVHDLHWLASSNYRLAFEPSTDLSERVIFPGGPTESRGMEDVRLVRFVHDDGDVVYYGTYTAFDGHTILPQLVETRDFASFRIATLSGESAQNKGIALFPRKLDGHFVALGRHDNVNNFLMTSDDVRVWRETEKIQEPERPWELIQLGNCGSPIETEAGWLVITHGVGPMRSYTLGALLLDIDDPYRVIGHLKEPLLAPTGGEREGYVPNVVYSCGGMIHDGHLVLPYGYADVGASIVTVCLDDLLTRLLG